MKLGGGLITACLISGFLHSHAASAQQWKPAAQLGIASGVEAGDGGAGQTSFRRARTRILVGLDAFVDERPGTVYGAVAFAELEPHLSLGAEFRWMHSFSTQVRAYAGPSVVIAPYTLFGATLGAQVHLDGVEARSGWYVEPALSVMPLGSDLPGDGLIAWGLVSLGYHAQF